MALPLLSRARAPRAALLLLVLAAAVLGLPGLTAAAAAADPLISQGKPATASGTENAAFPASAAVDGDPGTRWSSAFSDPQWIRVAGGTTPPPTGTETLVSFGKPATASSLPERRSVLELRAGQGA